MKLNIGGLKGELPKEYATVNICPGADYKLDLNELTYNFNDNSIDKIVCKNTIEHLNIDLECFFRELYRIMKPYALCYIMFPNFMFINYRIQYLLGQIPNYIHKGHNKYCTFEYVKYCMINAGFKVMLKKKHFSPIKLFSRHIKLVGRKVV